MDSLILFQNIEKCLRSQAPLDSEKLLDGRICFYSGTFNPWHKGHSACIDLHFSNTTAIPLMVLPDINPQKNISLNLNQFEALKINLNQQFNKYLQLHFSSVFLEQGRPNPTVHWIKTLKKSFPKIQMGLLMGMDCFYALDSWQQSEDLLKTLSFLEVVPRKTQEAISLMEVKRSKYGTLYPNLQISLLPQHPFLDEKSSTQRQ